MAHSSEAGSRRWSLIWTGVVLHVVLVAVFASVLLLAQAESGPDDANIAQGLAKIPVMALGFPWSMLADPVVPGSGFGFDFVIIGTALVNVGLHAGLIMYLDKRSWK